MTIKSVILLAAVHLVLASPIADGKPDPTLTTATHTFTGTAVYNSIVSDPPYWETVTSTFLWTQTETAWVYPTAS